MASIISVDTLQDSAGSNEITTANVKTAFDDRVKAWVFYTTKTTTSIFDSNNVSSLSDLGTARTEITVTNAYSSSTSYNVATFAGDQGTSTAFATDVESTRNTTTFGIDTRNTSNTRIDCNRVNATSHGDLA